MESSSYFKQARHSTSDLHSPFAWFGDAGENLQKRALPCSISANDADHLAPLDFKINLPESPKLLYLLAAPHCRPSAICTRASESLDLSGNCLAQGRVTFALHVVAD